MSGAAPLLGALIERKDNMKNTPAPWAATTRQGSWDWVVFRQDEPNIEICQMFHDGTEFNEEGKANSFLVASAPDLLEACELIVLFCEKDGKPVDGFRFREGIAKARAAIAKCKTGA